MKTFVFILILLAVLVGGGLITAQLASIDGIQNMPAARIQTSDPEASVFVATNWQAQQFFLMIGFILINLVGIGVTLAAIFWFLSRQVASVKETGTAAGGEQAGAIQKAE